MYYFYKTTNLVNGKVYYGVHNGSDKNYLGSGKALLNAVKKHGRKNFKHEPLKFFETEKEAFNYEKEFLTPEIINTEFTYNMGIGGKGGALFKGKKHTKDTIEKIKTSAALQVRQPLSPITKKKISKAMLGNKSKLGMTLSEETKQKIRDGINRYYLNKKTTAV